MRVELTKHAVKDVEKLSAQIKKRCAEAIRALAGSPLRGEPLKGEFQGPRRYRVGAFRIVYEVDAEADLLTIHAVKHRKDVYR